MIAYHVTWKSCLKSIKHRGLLPNHKPNNWPLGGRLRSKGKTFFCSDEGASYWVGTMAENLEPPGGKKDELVVLVVDLNGIDWVPDLTDEGPLEGDCWTRHRIPPMNIMEVRDIEPWMNKWLCL